MTQSNNPLIASIFRHTNPNPWRNVALGLGLISLLSACGGGSSSSKPGGESSVANSPKSSATASLALSSSAATSSATSQQTSSMNMSNAPTAIQAASAMGKGFNLGQMFDNDQHPRTLAAA